MGRMLSPDEIVSGFIPPVDHHEARPTKPRFRVRHRDTFSFLSGVFFGNPIGYRDALSVDIELPAEKPKHVYRDGINYHETEVLADNVFEVPDAELVAFNDQTIDKTEAFKQIMYSSASTLSAMDTASDYVGAALNDGLDLGLDMDDRPFAAFVHFSRLEVLSQAVELLNISPKQKRLMLGCLTKAMSDKAVEAMTAMDNGEKARRMLQAQMHAVVKPQTRQTEEADLFDKKLGHKRARL